jgi:hypothetical protein
MAVMNEAEKALVYVELRELFNALDARAWLIVPNAALAGRCPNDCSFADVMRVIDMLKSGAFA